MHPAKMGNLKAKPQARGQIQAGPGAPGSEVSVTPGMTQSETPRWGPVVSVPNWLRNAASSRSWGTGRGLPCHLPSQTRWPSAQGQKGRQGRA